MDRDVSKPAPVRSCEAVSYEVTKKSIRINLTASEIPHERFSVPDVAEVARLQETVRIVATSAKNNRRLRLTATGEGNFCNSAIFLDFLSYTCYNN